MSEGDFDVIVLGTGLTESILAAALSKHGLKTAQLDLNPYYGAEQASLSVQEFITWAQSNPPGYSDFALSTTEPISQGRQYALSLHPSVIPSTGPLISSLIGSGVSRYGGFRLLENVAVHHQDKISLVPGSKEAIFKSKSIPLIDKRRLMRFLSFVAGTDDLPAAKELQGDQQHLPLPEFLDKAFNLKDKGLVNTITYALTYSARPSDPVLPALERLRQYLRSAGRYGTSPFLIAHYGSSGEIAQGFCRAAAVAGGVYILGREIISIEEQSMELGLRYKITMSDFPEPLTCKLLVSSLSFIPKLPLTPAVSAQSSRTAVARCIAIIDTPLYLDSPPPEASDTTDDGEATTQPPERSPMDAAVIVFPPSSESESAVTVLVVGEGTMSTPKERWIVYLSTHMDPATSSSPETILRPYLDKVLGLADVEQPKLPNPPLFTAFYTQHCHPTPVTPDSSSIIITPPLNASLPLPSSPDAAALNAEKVFRRVVGHALFKKDSGGEESDVEFWPPTEDVEADADGDD